MLIATPRGSSWKHWDAILTDISFCIVIPTTHTEQPMSISLMIVEEGKDCKNFSNVPPPTESPTKNPYFHSTTPVTRINTNNNNDGDNDEVIRHMTSNANDKQ